VNRRPQTTIVANPVLIGTATLLVALVSIFITYNANNGLPFVPTYKVDAIVKDADLLGHNAEVRIGGKRVGLVSEITAFPTKSGEPMARLKLELDQTAGPLPEDTLVRVRPKSVIGLKYLQLAPGDAKKTIPDGGTIPLRNQRTNVNLQDALNAFDAQTRDSIQRVTVDLGDGFAGRGQDLNVAIQAFPELLGHLAPVMRNLADARTDLDGLFRGIDSAADAVAPVSGQLVGLFDGAATTLDAIARVRGDFGAVIDQTPATERVAVQSLREVTPVLDDASDLVDDLRPGVQELPRASVRLARAVEAGTPVLGRAGALADRLGDTLSALRTLARDPATSGSVVELTKLLQQLSVDLPFIVPAQTRCNLFGLYGKNAGPTIGEGDENGNWFRFLPLQQTPDNPYKGHADGNLHVTPYGWTGPDSRCIAGNEKYVAGQQIGLPPNAATAPMTNPETRPPADALGR
jgi:virulence factor Mce-like protein